MAKRKEYNLPPIFFIDYEKAHDNVNREILQKMLTGNGIPNNIIAAIQRLYKKILIKLPNHQLSKILNINKGVRQSCDVSPALFNLYINQLIRE